MIWFCIKTQINAFFIHIVASYYNFLLFVCLLVTRLFDYSIININGYKSNKINLNKCSSRSSFRFVKYDSYKSVASDKLLQVHQKNWSRDVWRSLPGTAWANRTSSRYKKDQFSKISKSKNDDSKLNGAAQGIGKWKIMIGLSVCVENIWGFRRIGVYIHSDWVLWGEGVVWCHSWSTLHSRRIGLLYILWNCFGSQVHARQSNHAQVIITL